MFIRERCSSDIPSSYFLCLSKVWNMLDHGSVWQIQKRMLLYIFRNFFGSFCFSRSRRPEEFCPEMFCLRPATFLRKSLAQVFSCEVCEISKNPFFYRTPPVAASVFHDEICFYDDLHSKYGFFYEVV